MGLRDESRKEYGIIDDSANSSEIKLGCIQRIADATELMAKNHAELIEERDKYKRLYYRGMRDRESLERRISAFKGVITKLKRKM